MARDSLSSQSFLNMTARTLFQQLMSAFNHEIREIAYVCAFIHGRFMHCLKGVHELQSAIHEEA